MSLKVFIEEKKNFSSPEARTLAVSSRQSTRSLYQARLERKWLETPVTLFNHELLRRERLCRFITEQGPFKDLTVLDIGCGDGFFARFLRDQGAHVTAIDGAHNALRSFERLDATGVTLQQDIFPYLNISDKTFDLIIAFDLLAELDGKDYRLAMSELSRLIKPEGKVLLATPLDPDTIDPLFYLKKLVGTEFTLEKTICSYDLYSRKLPEWLNLNKTLCVILEKMAHFLHGEERATYAMVSATRKKFLNQGR